VSCGSLLRSKASNAFSSSLNSLVSIASGLLGIGLAAIGAMIGVIALLGEEIDIIMGVVSSFKLEIRPIYIV
jgi:hypothetical protein